MARSKAFDEEVVIERAMEMFRRRGYEATSIRDLVAHLGLSSSSLYNAFGDKDALFMLALQRHSRQERAMIQQRLADPTQPQATVKRLFDDAIAQLLSEELPYASLTLRAAVELGVNKPTIAAFLSAYLDDLTHLLADYLDEATRRGYLALANPAYDTARYLLLALFTLSILAQMAPDRSPLETYSRVVLRVLDGAAVLPTLAEANVSIGG